jgi:hypothetical protein
VALAVVTVEVADSGVWPPAALLTTLIVEPCDMPTGPVRVASTEPLTSRVALAMVTSGIDDTAIVPLVTLMFPELIVTDGREATSIVPESTVTALLPLRVTRDGGED